MRVEIRSSYVVPVLSEIRLSAFDISDSMVQGFRDVGPHPYAKGRLEGQLWDPKNISITQTRTEGNFALREGDKPQTFSGGTPSVIARGFVPGPYAAIQNVGGPIPDRRPVRASAMRWVDRPTNQIIFARFAKGFELRPQRFIQAGLRRVMENFDKICHMIWIYKRGDT